MSVVTRFAPSPTGRLHVGNLWVAVRNWLFARKASGCFLLRLDDTDRERSTAAYADAILEDLRWLGLEPDAVFRQSERASRYDAALARLERAGRVYRCYETAEELDMKRRVQLARGLPPVYDRTALKLGEAERAALEAAGARPHWRFLLEREAPVVWDDLVRGPSRVEPASLSDPVVRREDGSYLYMLPSVVDDIDLGVTHVIRGEDHVANSGIQLQMADALGARPPALAHLPLLATADGPLSKRLGSGGVDQLREAGYEPLAVVAYLARLGTADPIEPVQGTAELVERFDLARLGRAAARFDEGELAQLNAKIVHRLPFAMVRARLPAGMDEAAWTALRPNLAAVAQAQDWWPVIAGPVPAVALAPEDRAFVAAAARQLARERFDEDLWSRWTAALAAESGRKGRRLFLPLRLALTGRDHGPEMAVLLPLIGRETALARLASAADTRIAATPATPI